MLRIISLIDKRVHFIDNQEAFKIHLYFTKNSTKGILQKMDLYIVWILNIDYGTFAHSNFYSLIRRGHTFWQYNSSRFFLF
jgi:hypothetical protein